MTEHLSVPAILECSQCGTPQKCYDEHEPYHEYCPHCKKHTLFIDNSINYFYNSIKRNAHSIITIIDKRLNKLNKGQ